MDDITPELKSEFKKQFGKDLTDSEFNYFCELIKAFKANPFKGEIFAVVYEYTNNKGNPIRSVAMFCGKNLYVRVAQENKYYRGHYSDCVFSKDKFQVIDGVVNHSYNNADRGQLIGAYCVVYHEKFVKPFFKYVHFKECNKGTPTWNQQPCEMLSKNAVSKAVREVFMGVFAGTYDESERWIVEKALSEPSEPETANLKAEIIETKVVDHRTADYPPDSGWSNGQPIDPKFISAAADVEKIDTFTTIDAIKAYWKDSGFRDSKFYKAIEARKEEILSFLAEEKRLNGAPKPEKTEELTDDEKRHYYQLEQDKARAASEDTDQSNQ